MASWGGVVLEGKENRLWDQADGGSNPRSSTLLTVCRTLLNFSQLSSSTEWVDS